MDASTVRKALRSLADAGIDHVLDEQACRLHVILGDRRATFRLADGEHDQVYSSYRLFPLATGPVRDQLLVFPELAPQAQAEIRQAGMNYLDTVGNGWLQSDGLVVRLVGRKVRPATQRSGFSAAECKVVFALLASPVLRAAPTREIAAWSGTSLHTVARAFDRLDAEGFLHRSGATVAARRDWERLPDLLGLWAHAYTAVLRPKLLSTTRFRMLRGGDWRDLPVETVDGQWSEAGAVGLLGSADLHAASALLYTDRSRADLARLLGLVPDPEGAIRLARRFWGATPLMKKEAREVRVAPVPLLVADLRALHDSRANEAADTLARLWQTHNATQDLQ